MPRKDPGPAIHFDAAIEAGNLDSAWEAACNLSHMTLDRYLSMAVLMGEHADPKAEAVARKFLARFLHTYKPSLALYRDITAALHEVCNAGFLADEERAELQELARRIRSQSLEGWKPKRWMPPPPKHLP